MAGWLDSLLQNTSFVSRLIEVTFASSALIVVVLLIFSLLRNLSASTRAMIWTVLFLSILVLQFAPHPRTRVNIPIIPTMSEARLTTFDNLKDPVETGINHDKDSGQTQFNISTLLTVIWISGTGLTLVWIMIGWVGLFRIRSKSMPIVKKEVLQFLDTIGEKTGIDSAISLRHNPSISTAIMTGVFRRVIILPSEALDWENDKLSVVLLHELAHVKRRDNLFHIVVQLMLILFWYNPLIWLAVSKFQAERERACDDLVLNIGTKASSYAGFLMKIAAELGSRRKPLWQVTTVSQGSSLKDRLMCILDPKLNRSDIGIMTIIISIISISVATFSFAAFDFWRYRTASSLSEQTQPDSMKFIEQGEKTGEDSDDPESVFKDTNTDQMSLANLLYDERTEIRMMAVKRIAALPDNYALPLLIEASKNEVNGVRRIALETLMYINDPKAYRALEVAAQNDPNSELRQMASKYIADKEQPVSPARDSEYEQNLALFRSGTEEERLAMIDRLFTKNEIWAQEIVIAAIDDPHERVRFNATAKLLFLNTEMKLKGLQKATKSSDEEVRKIAASYLSQMSSNQKARDILFTLINDPNVVVRRTARSTLNR